jgi:hypothetical protein
MLQFLKKNGFPIDLFIETIKYESPDNSWSGCQSTARNNETGEEIDTFFHNTWHDRALWCKGFLIGLGYKDKKDQLPEWLENYSGCQL